MPYLSLLDIAFTMVSNDMSFHEKYCKSLGLQLENFVAPRIKLSEEIAISDGLNALISVRYKDISIFYRQRKYYSKVSLKS